MRAGNGTAGTGRLRGRGVGPAIMVGVLAFVLTVEWRSQGRLESEVIERREALASIVQARQSSIAALEDRLEQLRDRFDQAAARSGERDLHLLRNETARLAMLSGASPVRGPGLVVELADAPDARRTDPSDADFLIHDVDLQAVVNALWAAGAESIAVNGQRLVSTSAIRNAGAVVRLNYKVLTSPYRIEAVGRPDDLRARFEASAIARRFADWAQIYGLGFSIAEQESLSLSGFAGSMRFRHARPIPE